MVNKKLLIAIILIALTVIVVTVTYLFSSRNNGEYPRSVENAISKPVQQVGEWKVLESTESYEISYSKLDEIDSFFITIIAAPATSNLAKAENAFLAKLDVSKEEACKLPVSVQVQKGVDDRLWGYDFGLSFCEGRLHVEDKLKPVAIPAGDTFYILTTKGERIEVKNFYKTAVKLESSRVVIKNLTTYQIYYYPELDNFVVETPAANETDLSTIAKPAASELVKALGVSESKICELPIMVQSSSNGELKPVSLAWLIGCK